VTLKGGVRGGDAGPSLGPARLPPPVLCIVGLAICVVIAAGVLAALRATEAFRRAYQEHYPGGDVPNRALPPWVANSWTHWCGLLVPICLPVLFIACWIVVLVKFA
jgi:hypothetical protein